MNQNRKNFKCTSEETAEVHYFDNLQECFEKAMSLSLKNPAAEVRVYVLCNEVIQGHSLLLSVMLNGKEQLKKERRDET